MDHYDREGPLAKPNGASEPTTAAGLNTGSPEKHFVVIRSTLQNVKERTCQHYARQDETTRSGELARTGETGAQHRPTKEPKRLCKVGRRDSTSERLDRS